MPGRFFSDSDRQRLSQYPPEINVMDQVTYFTLTEPELTLVDKRRLEPNRLGFALQLGTVRYLGFCPDDLTTAPATIVGYVAEQVKVKPAELLMYAQRPQTRTKHLQEIMTFLGFRLAETNDLEQLKNWLIERALEHNRPILLFQLAAERLYQAKIIRPGVTILERLIITARTAAQVETFQRLKPILTETMEQKLDGLLKHDEKVGQTPLIWLRQRATTNSPPAILETLKKVSFLRQLGVEQWDLSQLNPNRLKYLAQIAKKSTSQALRRATKERRYPIVLAFLAQNLIECTDEGLELYIRCLIETEGRARRERDEFRQQMARSTNEKIDTLQKLCRIVMNMEVTNEQVRPTIYQQIPQKELERILEECVKIARPLDDNYLDFLAKRYSYLRKFIPVFLATYKFHSHLKNYALLEALSILNDLNQTQRRKVPETATTAFVRKKWASYIFETKGQINRRYYELCALWELRNALRAGNIWVKNSRLYADPESYLIDHQQWPSLRSDVCQLIQAPTTAKKRLDQRQKELETLAHQFDNSLTKSELVRLEQGRLVLSPLSAEVLPQTVTQLQQLVTERLPQIELVELLIEVDRWVEFTQYFEHAGGQAPRTSTLQIDLYATILAQACNFGLEQMANITGISYNRLAWCNNWYIREDTLQTATNALINFHYQQPLTAHWGGGTLSSSDGQRFPVTVKTRNATALPRYFGYGRGLTFYTWTSDQFSQYGTKVVPATMRDATYLLDAILDNETELDILEHTTDTAGYTEIMFALFDLLGLQFAPRIRDIGDQQLYCIDRSITYQHLNPVLNRTLKCDRITQHWDDLLRIAGSLKLGWVTASLLVGKLQSFPRQNALAQALQEYGRLVKTIFILRYLQQETLRRRIHRQLNKGEALHYLRRFIFFANLGKIRRHHYDDQLNQASCLNLVTNAVIIWNTVYMTAVIEQLKKEGVTVSDEDIAHLSPSRFEHINPYGTYHFAIDDSLNQQQLRPLRNPQSLDFT